MVDSLQLSTKNEVHLEYASENEFQKVFDQSQKAFKRKFDAEEHFCKICARNLLGDKFFFLSGCEHFYCLECIRELVTLKVESGQIQMI